MSLGGHGKREAAPLGSSGRSFGVSESQALHRLRGSIVTLCTLAFRWSSAQEFQATSTSEILEPKGPQFTPLFSCQEDLGRRNFAALSVPSHVASLL